MIGERGGKQKAWGQPASNRMMKGLLCKFSTRFNVSFFVEPKCEPQGQVQSQEKLSLASENSDVPIEHEIRIAQR